jgi:threonine dehydratase
LLLLEKTHNLAEGGGAAALAGAIKLKDRLRGKKVALILSGGNISMERLRWILAETRV